MKKSILTVCLLLTAVLASAQLKKVAILEVVDREGRLSYGTKMMLRSNLARAITNTPGYEAYDRTDMDAIMSEHDFQRTGLVSEDQIKQLGQMTGVSLILVAEGASIGNNNLFVSAKILNVETAKVEMMDNITMSTESMAMQQGCNTLTNRMFNTGNSNQSNIEQRRTQYAPMSNKEYEWFLFNNCPEAYSLHTSGKKMTTAGWVLIGAGLAMIIAGAPLTDMGFGDDIKSYTAAGLPLIILGPLVGGAGGALVGVGYKRRNKAYQIYNNSRASTAATPLIFGISAGQNGLGLALQF